MIETAIENALRKKEACNWEWPMCWAIDLHDVIIKGDYTRGNDSREMSVSALRVLLALSQSPKMRLILFTSSHADAIHEILDWFSSYGVFFDYVNGNPACPNTELCDFGRKFFFDVLLDDKAGFDMETDWDRIYFCLKDLGLI